MSSLNALNQALFLFGTCIFKFCKGNIFYIGDSENGKRLGQVMSLLVQ